MKSLLVYLKDYKKECVLAPLFKMLEAIFELFVPLVIASIIDKGMALSDKGYVYSRIAILAILALVGFVSAAVAQFFSAKAAVGFSTQLRRDLFSHLMGLSFREYDSLGTSTMITRMTSDVMQAQTGVNMFLRLTLRSPFIVFGAMIMAFTIDAKAALVFLGVILLLFAVVYVIMKFDIDFLKKAQSALDRVLLLTRENLTGVRVLRAFSKSEEENAEFKKRTGNLYDRQIEAGRISALMNPVTYVLINLAVVVLIYVGAIRVDSGNMTQGSVVALYNYMSQILVELIKLANMTVTLNKAIASGDRIVDVLKLDNSQEILRECKGQMRRDKGSADGQGDDSSKDCGISGTYEYAVEFDNVSFKYNKGGDDALSGISFKVRKGEIIGVIGGTGSGKTTLVSLIPGLYDADEGTVKTFGCDLKKTDLVKIRERIGYASQKSAVFSGSIRDNLTMGCKNTADADLIKAMETAVALDVLKVKGGLDGKISKAGSDLSGGQKQRINIARAINRRPEILIFDDSTSALDYATQAEFVDNLRRLDFMTTVFVVSQRTNAVMGADRIIVLDDGKIAGIGRHEELMENCCIYKDIYDSQFKSAKEL